MELESLITEEMKKEEKNLEEENIAKEKELLENSHKEIEKEISEQRYNRLMHLLTKSQFYSEYLLSKIKQQKEEEHSKNKRKRFKPNPKEEKENSRTNDSTSESDSSQESSSQKRTRKSKTKALYELVPEQEILNTNNNLEKAAEPRIRELQPDLFENGEMRPYQLDGFTWLKTLFENGVNGILADEMGLGKTIQCIALICHLICMGIPGPFLIVAPLSTLPNWISEFRRFAPKVPILLYHGSEMVRKEMRQSIDKKLEVSGREFNCCPVVITSYEISIKDSNILRHYFWRYMAVDEGQRLKNHKCMLFKALSRLSTRNRIILTGTPLQNNLTELWALLNFLLPDIFDNLSVFESWFEIDEMMEEGSDLKIVQQEREKHIVSTLHKILSPFLLRRVKADVDLQIPLKKELLVYVPLTSIQLKLYEATITKDFSSIIDSEVQEKPLAIELNNSGRPKRESKGRKDLTALLNNSENDEGLNKYLQEAIKDIIPVATSVKKIKTSVVNLNYRNIMMQTRKIVNHPYLIKYPLTSEGEFKIDEELLRSCGKLQVLDQILRELQSKGHKVLLFSQMTKLLDIIEDYLSLRPNFKYRRLDGSVTLNDRRRFIDEFNNNEEYFLFLLSTRAGGLGINLASADTVIIYDSDWNPQQDLQAQDRCHRIGQTRPVLVLRFVVAATIDQRMVERAAKKRKLEKMIMKSGKFKTCDYEQRNMNEKIDPNELLALLRSRDHQRVHRTSSGNDVFTKSELDQLLDRRDLEKNSKGKLELKGVFTTISEKNTLEV